MWSLVGIANTKATKGPTTAFGAFCGKKLQEANHGVISIPITCQTSYAFLRHRQGSNDHSSELLKGTLQ